jgi:dephospho-CoA kinase
MLLVGVTGGVGMGKSTVAEFFASQGERVIDTDAVAREMVEPGQPALAEIRAAFGESVFKSDGTLERRKLAEKVFADEGARKVLEEILHPRIRVAWKQRTGRWGAEGARVGFVIIPLLFETAAETEFGWILCVGCSAATQRERLLARGWTPAEAGKRIDAQWPLVTKMDRANGVIWNEGPMDVCWKQAARLLEVIKRRA